MRPNPTTGTKNAGTKADHGANLAENQRVSNPTGVEYPFDRLPYSEPHSILNEAQFAHGWSSTEAPGELYEHAGRVNLDYEAGARVERPYEG